MKEMYMYIEFMNCMKVYCDGYSSLFGKDILSHDDDDDNPLVFFFPLKKVLVYVYICIYFIYTLKKFLQ